jgi:hypothetical protein
LLVWVCSDAHDFDRFHTWANYNIDQCTLGCTADRPMPIVTVCRACCLFVFNLFNLLNVNTTETQSTLESPTTNEPSLVSQYCLSTITHQSVTTPCTSRISLALVSPLDSTSQLDVYGTNNLQQCKWTPNANAQLNRRPAQAPRSPRPRAPPSREQERDLRSAVRGAPCSIQVPATKSSIRLRSRLPSHPSPHRDSKTHSSLDARGPPNFSSVRVCAKACLSIHTEAWAKTK